MNNLAPPGSNAPPAAASTTVKANAVTVPQKRRTKRADFACSNCRRRKVRCNLNTRGRPCANCRFDGWECVVPDRKKMVRGKRMTRSRPQDDMEAACTALLTDADSVLHGISPKQGGTQDLGIQDFGRDKSEMNALIESVETPQRTGLGNHYDTEDMCSGVRLRHFTYFSFLRTSDLALLEESDLKYLENQRSLQIPTGELLDALISHYFLYVHPCLPIINEANFWSIFRNKENYTGSTFSLLVFQAMIFVASSYLPLNQIKKFGIHSLLSIRKTFYRRAKTLVDLNVEDDSLSIAQAAVLLTYYSSSLEKLSSTTWLSLAINHAYPIGAHQYNQYTGVQCNQSDLKRLWWCILLRDKIIALGMRRPLQIHPTDLKNMPPEPLVLADLMDEIHGSEVYDAATKVALCKIVTSQCQLSIVLATLITALYPKDAALCSTMEREIPYENIESQLSYWKFNCMVPMCSQDTESHASVQLYKRLTCFYYESARLALYHNVSRHYERQQMWSKDFGLTGSHASKKPNLMSAVVAVSNQVKWFMVNNTASHLPVSVVAYTMLPQLVLNFNLRLSNHSEHDCRREKSDLKFYTEFIHMCALRYDIAHMTKCLQGTIVMFDLSRSHQGLGTFGTVRPATDWSILADSIVSDDSAFVEDTSDPTQSQSGLCSQLFAMMDISLSTGQQPKTSSQFPQIAPSIEPYRLLRFPFCSELRVSPPLMTCNDQSSPGFSDCERQLSKFNGSPNLDHLLAQGLPWDPHFLSDIVPLLQDSPSFPPLMTNTHDILPPDVADEDERSNRDCRSEFAPTDFDSSNLTETLLTQLALLGE